MSPITHEDAYAQTSDNPAAYNLNPHGEKVDQQLEKARVNAAAALVAGVAANDAYWNSRGDLEQLVARAQGHGQVVRGEGESSQELDTQTAPATIEGRMVPPETEAGQERPVLAAGTAPVGSVGSTATDTGPTPSPDNPQQAIAQLRAQLEALGETPEA